MYSTSKATEDTLREFKGGRLAANSTDIKDSFPIINDIRLPLANPPPPRDHVLRPVDRFRRKTMSSASIRAHNRFSRVLAYMHTIDLMCPSIHAHNRYNVPY